MTVYNWNDRVHAASSERPCRWCGASTILRDYFGEPSHKLCAEAHADVYAECFEEEGGMW